MAIGRGFPWMLDVDEHSATVRRRERAGDFAAARTGQEALDLASVRIDARHLIVADVGVVGRSDSAGRSIGLNPEPPLCVEPEAVRGPEEVSLDISLFGRRRIGGISGENEEIPTEGDGAVVTSAFAPADDLTEHVVRARIGRVDAGVRP